MVVNFVCLSAEIHTVQTSDNKEFPSLGKLSFQGHTVHQAISNHL